MGLLLSAKMVHLNSAMTTLQVAQPFTFSPADAASLQYLQLINLYTPTTMRDWL